MKSHSTSYFKMNPKKERGIITLDKRMDHTMEVSAQGRNSGLLYSPCYDNNAPIWGKSEGIWPCCEGDALHDSAER